MPPHPFFFGMHPFYYRHHFGFGRRLIWFGIGALTASWWHKHHVEGAQWCRRRDEYIKNREEQGFAGNGGPAPVAYQSNFPSHSSVTPPAPPSYPPVVQQESLPTPKDINSWSAEKFDKQRLRELGTQATDAVSFILSINLPPLIINQAC